MSLSETITISTTDAAAATNSPINRRRDESGPTSTGSLKRRQLASGTAMQRKDKQPFSTGSRTNEVLSCCMLLKMSHTEWMYASENKTLFILMWLLCTNTSKTAIDTIHFKILPCCPCCAVCLYIQLGISSTTRVSIQKRRHMQNFSAKSLRSGKTDSPEYQRFCTTTKAFNNQGLPGDPSGFCIEHDT